MREKERLIIGCGAGVTVYAYCRWFMCIYVS